MLNSPWQPETPFRAITSAPTPPVCRNANNVGVIVVATSNTIGGTTASARNVHRNNSRCDDLPKESCAGKTTGLNAGGTSAIPNGYGVEMIGGTSTIGGSAAGTGNVISGNNNDGVRVTFNADGTTIQGNRVGTSPTGTLSNLNGANGFPSTTSRYDRRRRRCRRGEHHCL